MFAYFKGIVNDIEEDSLVLLVHDVGYLIHVGKTTSASLNSGDEVCFYTYTAVREDDISIYGFLTKKELELFKLLITVNGVGAKFALNILSALPVESVCGAILSADTKTLSSVNGIGAKTAQRIILDLTEKVKNFGFEAVASKDNETVKDSDAPAKREAVEGLVSLGYSRANAFKAVSMANLPSGSSCEEYLKAGLKNIFTI